jgi:hypothetical protein
MLQGDAKWFRKHRVMSLEAGESDVTPSGITMADL